MIRPMPFVRRVRSRAAAVVLVALGLALALGGAPSPARAALAAPLREVLVRYLDALSAARYDAAFALLAPRERAYFGSADNLASSYRADRLRVESYRIVGSTSIAGTGTLAIVSERVRFFDHAHQVERDLRANVRYGIVPTPDGPRIKDPYHPWRAVVPAAASVETQGIRATIRKASFFTGRVELVVTFQNFGSETVTLLPYGKSVLRDDAGTPHVPLATRVPGLTDRVLFEGLRLAPSAQYTGALTFATPDRYAPHALTLTLAPAVADGGDAPFDLALPAFPVAASH